MAKMEFDSKTAKQEVNVMYTKRAIEEVLKKAERQTKVILLTGARQVGKSTEIPC